MANRLFAERGYEDVHVEDIAREAGVARGLIHHYFGGKREVYLALVAELADTARGLFDVPRSGTPEERVAQTIDAWLDWVDANREIWVATGGRGQDISDPEVAAVVNARREGGVGALIGSHSDFVKDGPALRFALRSWLGLQQSACRAWVEGRASREDTHDLLVSTLLHILRTYGK